MWQVEDDSVSSLSALPATAVGQILLTMAFFCHNTVQTSSILEKLSVKPKRQVFLIIACFYCVLYMQLCFKHQLLAVDFRNNMGIKYAG